ncbi:hypothetical protein [Actinokineospora diospyrosa]|uniref:PspA domain-containing protein n=1 Tax=Actinokineospora diospyrosa TaxID=103728 RepID=A0ABT1I6W7_9PSEU|nr:hypothetical protein [Actinokineospora diospyrosa]MCP2268141.1 hypothetical protein [Actinokineospora diospyrosa]
MSTSQGDDDPTVVDAEIVASPTPAVELPAAQYSESGVPSFDYVRERIENRAATATGSTELAGIGGTGPDVKSLDEQLAEREEAGRARLAEIRRAMGKD